MSSSFFAEWLDKTFSGFDYAILSFMHMLAQGAGAVLTPIAKFITFIGEKGIVFLLLALVLMCFSKTRKAGICVFGAVCCGALITNICLKDIICRIRPLEATETFKSWWQYVGSPFEDGFSFPSGHVTAAMSALTALCLVMGKKYIIPSAAFVLLMAASRNYLMAHYPTDVIAGIIVGGFAAVIAYFITKLIYGFLEKNKQNSFSKFVLDFDLRQLFKSR